MSISYDLSSLCAQQFFQVVYNEFEGFRCYGYKTTKPRRAQRMCDMFISCPPLKLEEVKPLVCGKIEVVSNNKTLVAERSRNPEDAFYWDPVFAHVLRRSGTSSVMSPTSPRALSPPSLDGSDGENEESDPQPTIEPWRTQAALAAAALTGHHPSSGILVSAATRSRPQPPPFETAEDTLRALLLESDRIKQLVSDAETKARSRLSNRPAGSDEVKSSASRPLTGSNAADR